MKQIKCPTCRGRGFVMARSALEELAMTILLAVADRNSMPVDILQGRSRAYDICRVRAEAIKELRTAGLTLKEIGLFVGGRDHSTILHALHRDQISTQRRVGINTSQQTFSTNPRKVDTSEPTSA